jgi:hypothetical protein
MSEMRAKGKRSARKNCPQPPTNIRLTKKTGRSRKGEGAPIDRCGIPDWNHCRRGLIRELTHILILKKKPGSVALPGPVSLGHFKFIGHFGKIRSLE